LIFAGTPREFAEDATSGVKIARRLWVEEEALCTPTQRIGLPVLTKV
jgi:hypothetical protein